MKLLFVFLAVAVTAFGRRHHRHHTDVDVDSPSPMDRLMHKMLTFKPSAPWWNGENVCETTTKEDSEDEGMDGFYMEETKCFSSAKEHRCVKKVSQDGRLNITTVVKKCCHGFENVPGQMGCSKPVELTSLLDTLRALNLTKFTSIIDEPTMSSILTSGNVTVFAPTDDAFTTYKPEPVFYNVETDADEYMEEVFRSHVVPRWLSVNEMGDETVYGTLSGTPLRTNLFWGPMVTANCAQLTRLDIPATNGVVHVIDNVLTPVKMTSEEFLKKHNDVSEFFSLVPRELRETLKDVDTHHTIYAFSNKAFDALDRSMRDQIKNSPCYKDIAKHHMLPFTMCPQRIQRKSKAVTLMGTHLEIDRIEDKVVIGGANAQIMSTTMTKNGLVHIIDDVIIDREMMNPVERLATSKVHTFMGKKVKELGKEQEMNSQGNYTMFVVEDSAFKSMDEITYDMVKTHTMKGMIMLDPMQPVQRVTNMHGKHFNLTTFRPYFLSKGQTGMIQCSRVIQSNLKTCGGVLHVLDKPLQAPSKPLFDLINSNPNNTRFSMMLEAAGMDEVINKADFLGTVFVPDDAALERQFDDDEIDALLTSEKLPEFVKMHILKKPHCCNELFAPFNRHNRVTLSGKLLNSYFFGTYHMVGNGQVRKCDSIATNGIVHNVNKPVVGV